MRSAKHSSTGLPPIQVQATSFLARTGARKVRWGRAGKGKRGGVRVIYFHLADDEIVLLVMVYAKAVQANVKPKDIKRG
jgi:mRNA-degrading endonuclease RelE of RelBE toxin-antitoxin system